MSTSTEARQGFGLATQSFLGHPLHQWQTMDAQCVLQGVKGAFTRSASIEGGWQRKGREAREYWLQLQTPPIQYPLIRRQLETPSTSQRNATMPGGMPPEVRVIFTGSIRMVN